MTWLVNISQHYDYLLIRLLIVDKVVNRAIPVCSKISLDSNGINQFMS